MRHIIILLLIFGLLVSTCCADEVDALHLGADKHEISIGYTPICKHYESGGDDLNENIDFVMVSVDKWMFATYNNSHYERSYFAGKTFRTDKKPFYEDKLYYRFNLTVGLLTGYDDEIPTQVGNVAIVPFPTIEVGYKNFSIDTLVVPLFGCLIKYTF